MKWVLWVPAKPKENKKKKKKPKIKIIEHNVNNNFDRWWQDNFSDSLVTQGLFAASAPFETEKRCHNAVGKTLASV